MAKLPLNFSLALLASLVFAFCVHLGILNVLDLPLWDNLIVLSYVLNFVLALGIFLGLYFLRNRLGNSMGFLFMAGSLLKFVVFFLVFYPVYKSDGTTQGVEFAAFFVPYAIALVLETFFTSKMLKNLGGK
ncbi:DUF6168 family protein [Allomuricauda sp. SCSIO 65647]|uniref:DUF6168 family protein n=1 Tax=Allomuricauda sp. SCSIO 65647 TaxID=2908843 RepID=UPI001F38D4CF|nr:DUF6168 family protein [Muricauda sp. SCSIO 65647]UJH69016.1 DUF6168 family protein [Muricauda sp. SCSIO 65647]